MTALIIYLCPTSKRRGDIRSKFSINESWDRGCLLYIYVVGWELQFQYVELQ